MTRASAQGLAFLDLLGTRAASGFEVEDFRESRQSFRDIFALVAQELEPGDKEHAYLFSDCAYVEMSSSRRILDLLDELRYQATIRSLFFRASCAKGVLEAMSAAALPLSEDEPKKDTIRRNAVLSGYQFGAAAARLYELHERHTGIGINVDPALVKADRGKLVLSCRVARTGGLESFFDIRVGRKAQAESRAILEIVLAAFFSARCTSRSISRNYVPLLVTWIQSVEIDTFGEAGAGTYHLARSITSGEFERTFGDVPGVEAVYFALLARVYREQSSTSKLVLGNLKEFLRARPRIVRKVAGVPTEILSLQERAATLGGHTDELVGRPGSTVQRRQRIQELADRGLTNDEIAKTLQREGVLNPRRRPWTPSDVARELAAARRA